MPPLTADDAEMLRTKWAPLFSSAEAFNASWNRCWDVLRKPTAGQADKWLAEDLELDKVRNRGIAQDAVEGQNLRQSFELSDCRHCGGLRYVRADVPVRHPDFGRAIPCQFCDKPDHKTACDLCRTPAVLTGYLGPETPSVPADWEPGKSIPDGWRSTYDRHGQPLPAEASA